MRKESLLTLGIWDFRQRYTILKVEIAWNGISRWFCYLHIYGHDSGLLCRSRGFSKEKCLFIFSAKIWQPFHCIASCTNSKGKLNSANEITVRNEMSGTTNMEHCGTWNQKPLIPASNCLTSRRKGLPKKWKIKRKRKKMLSVLQPWSLYDMREAYLQQQK